MSPSPRERGDWIYLSRELLADLVDVVDAEVGAAREDLGRSGKLAGKGSVLLAAAASVLLWVPALLAYVLIRVLAQWLPDWGAGLIVLGLFLALAGVLVAIGWSRLKKVENPVDTVTRRVHEHLGWWRSEVALRPRPVAVDDDATPGGEP